MGRTGKKNPRLAQTFIEWADEESIIKILQNTYDYVSKYIDTSLDKEHVGYIVDRTGYPVFKEHILKDVTLNPKAKVAEFIDFSGYKYEKDTFMK
jgi:anaerobic sulfite reductase subunit C